MRLLDFQIARPDRPQGRLGRTSDHLNPTGAVAAASVTINTTAETRPLLKTPTSAQPASVASKMRSGGVACLRVFAFNPRRAVRAGAETRPGPFSLGQPLCPASALGVGIAIGIAFATLGG